MYRKDFCREHEHFVNMCPVFLPWPDRRLQLTRESSIEMYCDAFYRLGKNRPLCGQHCKKPRRPGSLTCGDWLCEDIMSKFRISNQTEVQLPQDASRNDKKLRERCWQNINQHMLIGRKALVGHFVFVCACGTISLCMLRFPQCLLILCLDTVSTLAGIIIGHFPLSRPETYEDIMEFLDTKLFPAGSTLPDYLFYDRACHLTRGFKEGNSIEAFAVRWTGVCWRVDRFHFLGHDEADQHCR